MKAIHGLIGAILSTGIACADITAIGPFTDVWEGFENVVSPGGYPGPIGLFENQVTMDDSLAHFCVVSFVWSGPAGQVEAYNGNLFGGTVVGSTIFNFATPVTRFGGYLTTIGNLPDGTAIFRDSEGSEIGQASVSVTPTVWGWQGWQSTTPIASIEIIGSNVGMVSMQYDDLMLSYTAGNCPGDVDGDHNVGLTDLSILLGHFGVPSGATWQDGDLDGDGDVDLSDLSVLLANFGTSC